MRVNLVHSTGGFGFGDCEPPEHPDYNTTCTCEYCGRDFEPLSGEPELFCNETHWHLSRLGEVKAQVLSWIAQGRTEQQILRALKMFWFYWMSDSTCNRWKRAIHNRFNTNAEI